MAERVVVDASIAIPLLVAESATSTVRGLVRRWTDLGVELIVPSHFWLEVTNILGRRYARLPQAVVEGIVVLDELGLRTLEADRPLLLLAIDTMARHDLSAYDALYAALALSTGSALATLDRELAAAARTEGLRVEPADETRVSDDRPRSASARPTEPAWFRSAAVGRHIADLRRAALEQVN